MIARRAFLSGLASLVAAPTVIRTPGLLMPVRGVPVMVSRLVLPNQVVREAIKLFAQSNAALIEIDEAFAVRMPNGPLVLTPRGRAAFLSARAA